MEWDIFGHEWAARLLQKHIAEGETRHAYLFTGPSGVGRRSLALRFAQAVNCTQPPAPGVPCGTCRVCEQTARMQQADLSVVQPEEDSTQIKVEQIRDLQHSLSLLPYEARYRVALLLNFEDANANAQNALLKTLEEAPDKVILLLTTSAAEALLPTITSRCEVLRLRPMAIGELETLLRSRWQIPAQEAQLLAHLSGGRVGEALRMHEDPSLLERHQAYLQDMFELLEGNLHIRFAYAEQFKVNGREPLRRALEIWLPAWRDLFLLANGSQTPLTNIDQEPALRRAAQRITPRQALACTAAMEKALHQLDQNVNPQLLAEITLMDWPRV